MSCPFKKGSFLYAVYSVYKDQADRVQETFTAEQLCDFFNVYEDGTNMKSEEGVLMVPITKNRMLRAMKRVSEDLYKKAGTKSLWTPLPDYSVKNARRIIVVPQHTRPRRAPIAEEPPRVRRRTDRGS